MLQILIKMKINGLTLNIYFSEIENPTLLYIQYYLFAIKIPTALVKTSFK